MGFKENLKAELIYKDMKVKELAELSGVKKQTIDSYLRENGYTPSVEAAVKIAQVLGVSVEYLVNGHEPQGRSTSPPFPDSRVVLKNLEALNNRDRKIVLNLIKNLKEMEDFEKKAK